MAAQKSGMFCQGLYHNFSLYYWKWCWLLLDSFDHVSLIGWKVLKSNLVINKSSNIFTGIAIGINKGHKVTPRVKAARVSYRKGAASARTTFVRDIIQEVAGLAPYERRIIELLRNSQEKRARKLAKKKLGTFGRAKAKVESMTKIIAESRRVAGH